MMGSGEGTVLLLTGESFFETTEDAATAHCEELVESLQKQVDSLRSEEEEILEKQKALKSILYGRFGKSINLEA